MEKVKIAKKAPAPKKEEIFAGVLVEVRTEGTLSNGLLWWDKGSGLNTNYNTKKKQTMEVFSHRRPRVNLMCLRSTKESVMCLVQNLRSSWGLLKEQSHTR